MIENTDNGKTFLVVTVILLAVVLGVFVGCMIKRNINQRRINRPIGSKSKSDLIEKIKNFFSKKEKKEQAYENFENFERKEIKKQQNKMQPDSIKFKAQDADSIDDTEPDSFAEFTRRKSRHEVSDEIEGAKSSDLDSQITKKKENSDDS